jgi:hypothetical protein
MGLGEIAGRTRQEAARWWDRVRADGARSRPSPALAECHRRWMEFEGGGAGRFFAGASDERTPGLLTGLLPEAARETIAGADRTRQGLFDLLGYRSLSFGDPIDWHLDPVSGRRAPLHHASRLDPLDTTAVGDSKVVWELSRHQWMVELAQAYRLTGDEAYADVFVSKLEAWQAANPVGRGIHWTSSLEQALRVISWCWTLVLFRGAGALTAERFASLRASVEDHARHVERYLSHYFSPNTHLTGEALGLFYAGVVFPDLPGAARWRERGAEILVRELARQVRGDGVYFEQTTCYQRYSVEIALHLLILAARVRFALPPAVADQAQAMLDFLLAVRSPDGALPQIGDSDGGWLLPLFRRPAGDVRGVFGVAAALFGRADYAWAAGGVVPELLWTLGPAGLADFEALPPSPPASAPSRLFPDGGYAVMRDSWEADAHHLVFDVGSLGCPVSGGHGHADLLSIQCSAFGEPFLVDAGTGTYAEKSWRQFFRGSAAHSTLIVDGLGQAQPRGPFTWDRRPAALLRRWVSTTAFDLADAEHDAYACLPDPVRHRRRVLFVKRRYWVVVDDVMGAEAHEVELRFQFGGRTRVDLEEDSWVRARRDERALLLRSFATVPLERRVARGGLDPIEGWVSADYGQQQPAPALVARVTAALPLRVVTVVLPVACPTVAPPAVTALRAEGRLVGLVFEATQETVVVGDDELAVRTAAADRRD